MKDMIKRIREEKGGFTLAELLIVVAIILVLVAIAVPVFTGALNSANDSVREGNIHALKSTAAAAIFADDGYEIPAGVTEWTVEGTVAADGTVTLDSVTEGAPTAESAEKNADGDWEIVTTVTQTDLPTVTVTP